MQNVKAGDFIGRYELVREVSTGFPGALWLLNFQHDGQRMLALGRIVQSTEVNSEATWQKLTESAWDAMEVEHPCIASAADVVFEEARLLTVYDYSEGEPLTVLDRLKTVQNAPIPSPVALRIALDLLDALEALHTTSLQLGAAHAYGGVGPDSLLVGTDGCTRLLDIFVAGAASEQRELRMHPDRVRYVAPEQFASEFVDARADVYALGCLLWELLANRRLHIGSPEAVERRVRLGQLPPLRGVAALDDAVSAIVEKALSFDPRHRYESAAAMAAQLRSVAPAIAERGVVAQFVTHLASRQLQTRRRVTEQSTIARLKDLLDSRPPPREARRSVAPPTPLVPSLLSNAPAEFSPKSVSKKTLILKTRLDTPDPTLPQTHKPDETLVDPRPRFSPLDAPELEEPTVAMPQHMLESMVSSVERASFSDTQARTEPRPHRSLNQGTLLGMPVPDGAAAFKESLNAARAAKGRSPAPSSGQSSLPASERVEPHRLVKLESTPPGRAEALAAPLALQPTPTEQAPTPLAVWEAAPTPSPDLDSTETSSQRALLTAYSASESELEPSFSKRRDWQKITWFFGGCSATLMVVLIVMWLGEKTDEGSSTPLSGAESLPGAVALPAGTVPFAASTPALIEPQPDVEPSAVVDEAVEDPEAVETGGGAGVVATSEAAAEPPKTMPKKWQRAKKAPKKFVPDEL